MRNFKDILKESILDDIDTQIKKGDKDIKDEIKSFLENNYVGTFKISRKPNSDGKYEVSSSKDIVVKNKNITSLTNGMFIWTTVNGAFLVKHCKSLTSLEGAPKEVEGIFQCSGCDSLTTLNGTLNKVGKDFSCSNCKSLTSLEGAPKEVGRDFYCLRCDSLKTLNGAPKEVGRYFDCSYCNYLTSLEGAPKEVGGSFACVDCKAKFTEKDVKKVSNVKKRIYC